MVPPVTLMAFAEMSTVHPSYVPGGSALVTPDPFTIFTSPTNLLPASNSTNPCQRRVDIKYYEQEEAESTTRPHIRSRSVSLPFSFYLLQSLHPPPTPNPSQRGSP